MKMTSKMQRRKWRQPKNEDDFKKRDDLKNWDKLKEDNLTIKDDLKIVKDHTALPFTAIAVIFM